MHYDLPTTIASSQTTLGPLARRAMLILLPAGVLALLIGLLLGWFQGDSLSYFLHAYLYNYCYFLSLSLGALFFVLLQHATRAGWSVTVRRLAELLAGVLPWMAIPFLPIAAALLVESGISPRDAAGEHSLPAAEAHAEAPAAGTILYEWANANYLAEHPLVAQKQPYLTWWFFLLRAAGYLVVWGWLGWWYLHRSTRQDETGEVALTLQMEGRSYPALILFGVTVTFAAFDWMMSLEPRWYSTIFGLYYFAGAAVGALALMILAAVSLQATGRLRDLITVEHYHDLGKLLLAFVIFWGYMAFSQYMLIWYANIPEENFWYQPRQTGWWIAGSLALLFGHLLIPFLGLLSREVKRRKLLLAFWAVWILAFHWLDLVYLVMPSRDYDRTISAATGIIDVACLIGLGCLYAAAVFYVARQRPLVALKDPRVGEALAFENY